MPPYNPNEYEPVEDRIRAFWADHPDGRIHTELVAHTDKQFIVKAFITVGSLGVVATGYAEETVGSSPVNRTNALENCETSAIGRALANYNYAPKGKRPSREEMQKANRAPTYQRPSQAASDEDEPPPRVTRVAEAKDELRKVCRALDLELKDVVKVYTGVHGVHLSEEENWKRIREFTAELKNDPDGVMRPDGEEVKQ